MTEDVVPPVHLWISILMVRRGQPNLKTWSKFSPCWSVPLREATLGGMSERPEWFPAPSHHPSPSLSLSTFHLFLHLTILPPPPPQMCLFMCRAKWSDREKHLRGKKTLIRCDYLWSSINIPFGWKDSTRLNVLALISSQYYLSTHKMDELEVSFFSFKGLIIRDFNFLNYVS